MSQLEPQTFVETFFDSSIYKDILARNDEKGEYIVTTKSDSTYFLRESDQTVLELHFPEEIAAYVIRVKS